MDKNKLALIAVIALLLILFVPFCISTDNADTSYKNMRYNRTIKLTN